MPTATSTRWRQSVAWRRKATTSRSCGYAFRKGRDGRYPGPWKPFALPRNIVNREKKVNLPEDFEETVGDLLATDPEDEDDPEDEPEREDGSDEEE